MYNSAVFTNNNINEVSVNKDCRSVGGDIRGLVTLSIGEVFSKRNPVMRGGKGRRVGVSCSCL